MQRNIGTVTWQRERGAADAFVLDMAIDVTSRADAAADNMPRKRVAAPAVRRGAPVLALVIAAILSVMFVIVMGSRSFVDRERRALEDMSVGPRADLFVRSRVGAEALCVAADSDHALRPRCEDAAAFLLAFPECDGACRAFVRSRVTRRPTR